MWLPTNVQPEPVSIGTLPAATNTTTVARMPRITITINSSISVNPSWSRAPLIDSGSAAEAS
jgi:hypothetical protein